MTCHMIFSCEKGFQQIHMYTYPIQIVFLKHVAYIFVDTEANICHSKKKICIRRFFFALINHIYAYLPKRLNVL